MRVTVNKVIFDMNIGLFRWLLNIFICKTKCGSLDYQTFWQHVLVCISVWKNILYMQGFPSNFVSVHSEDRRKLFTNLGVKTEYYYTCMHWPEFCHLAKNVLHWLKPRDHYYVPKLIGWRWRTDPTLLWLDLAKPTDSQLYVVLAFLIVFIYLCFYMHLFCTKCAMYCLAYSSIPCIHLMYNYLVEFFMTVPGSGVTQIY